MQTVDMFGQELQQQMEDISGVLYKLVGAMEVMKKDIDKLYTFHEEDEKEKEEEEKREEEEQVQEDNPEMLAPEQNPELGQFAGTTEMEDDFDIELPDELIKAIMSLSDEELMELISIRPEVQQIIANNLNGGLA